MFDRNKKKAKKIKKAVKHHTQMLALFTAVIIIWWAIW
jgi:hypothetical protein